MNNKYKRSNKKQPARPPRKLGGLSVCIYYFYCIVAIAIACLPLLAIVLPAFRCFVALLLPLLACFLLAVAVACLLLLLACSLLLASKHFARFCYAKTRS